MWEWGRGSVRTCEKQEGREKSVVCFGGAISQSSQFNTKGEKSHTRVV